VLLRFNKDDEVLALPEPVADKPVRVAWRHFARGIALARAGKTEEAFNERTALMKAAAQIPEAQMWGGGGFLSARAAMDLAAIVLNAASHGPRAHTTSRFNSGGVPWQAKISSRMTSRRHGITRCASRSAPRC
jgi:hypothetical protein